MSDDVPTYNDFVKDHAVPEEDVKTWCQIGLDAAYHPKGGYWFPTDLSFDPEFSGQARHRDNIPRSDVLQFPAGDRSPELAGGGDAPDWVPNRTLPDELEGSV